MIMGSPTLAIKQRFLERASQEGRREEAVAKLNRYARHRKLTRAFSEEQQSPDVRDAVRVHSAIRAGKGALPSREEEQQRRSLWDSRDAGPGQTLD